LYGKIISTRTLQDRATTSLWHNRCRRGPSTPLGPEAETQRKTTFSAAFTP